MKAYVGRVRCFSPRELLLLFGFPKKFSFPSGLARKHRFKLIGNSVNVHVITAMLEVVFKVPGHATSTKNRFDRKRREEKMPGVRDGQGKWVWFVAVGIFVGVNVALQKLSAMKIRE